jgi:hypothetical protein
MLNNRELELQTIIKTLESKVHALKRELAVAQQNEQNRISEAISKEKKIMEEKDKTIEFLMQESKKLKQQGKQENSWRISQLTDDYHNTEHANK